MLPLLKLEHVDIPSVKLPSMVDFGLQTKDFTDHWGIRPAVRTFKKQCEDCSGVYPSALAEIVSENRRKAEQILREQ